MDHAAIHSLVEQSLGPPSYSGERHMIYVGDCRELLRRIPSGLFSLTVTSPPYNIGKEYERVLDTAEYIDWCTDWIQEVHRTTSQTGAFWLNVGYLQLNGKAKAVPIPYLLWDRVPMYLLQEVVWNYGAGVASRRTFSPRNEKLLWYVNDATSYVFNLDAVRDPNVKYPNQKKNGKLKCNPLGKNPSDVWQIPKVTSGHQRSSKERTPHPAQFPSALVDRVVMACSNDGDVVLDPFLGSGTTLDVASRRGRFGIGFEIDGRYAALAAKRIERSLEKQKRESAQISLF